MSKETYKEYAFKTFRIAILIAKVAKTDLESRMRESGIDITFPSYLALHLVSHKINTIHDISNKSGLTSATIVPIIDSLEKKAFLVREKDKNDRRRNILSLTSKGKSILKKVSEMRKSGTITKTLEKLGKEKASKLTDSFEEFAAQMLKDNVKYKHMAKMLSDSCTKRNL